MNVVTKPTEMALIFDGIGYHHAEANGNRLSARHGGKKTTNIGFFDGHVATFLTKDLPGGMAVKDKAATIAAFSLSNLTANFPPPSPKWLLEQQY